MDSSDNEAKKKASEGTSHPDTTVLDNSDDDLEMNLKHNEEGDRDKSDISAEIGLALKNFAPYFLVEMRETIQSVVSSEVSRVIRDEFDKRFPKEGESTPIKQTTISPEKQFLISKPKEGFQYKDFLCC